MFTSVLFCLMEDAAMAGIVLLIFRMLNNAMSMQDLMKRFELTISGYVQEQQKSGNEGFCLRPLVIT